MDEGRGGDWGRKIKNQKDNYCNVKEIKESPA